MFVLFASIINEKSRRAYNMDMVFTHKTKCTTSEKGGLKITLKREGGIFTLNQLHISPKCRSNLRL